MQKNLFLPGLVFFGIFLAACNPKEATKPAATATVTLSSAEKDSIQKKISGRIEEIIQGCKQLDVKAALTPYLNHPGFWIVSPDGTSTDYAGMVKAQEDFFNAANTISFATTKEDFHFLSNELVMCTWSGKNEFELKNGEKFLIDLYTGSMLFKKVNDEWSIVYAHESAAQPQKID